MQAEDAAPPLSVNELRLGKPREAVRSLRKPDEFPVIAVAETAIVAVSLAQVPTFSIFRFRHLHCLQSDRG